METHRHCTALWRVLRLGLPALLVAVAAQAAVGQPPAPTSDFQHAAEPREPSLIPPPAQSGPALPQQGWKARRPAASPAEGEGVRMRVDVARVQPDVKILGERRAKCPSPDELQEWFKPLEDISIDATPSEGPLPLDCSTNLFFRADAYNQGMPVTRQWARTEFNWQASLLAHQPLYWDDVPLERYGQTLHPILQPAISTARFFGTFTVIPYKIGVNRTHDLVYTLGKYRPGSPAPRVWQVLPFEWDALLFEGGAWVGLVFIFP